MTFFAPVGTDWRRTFLAVSFLTTFDLWFDTAFRAIAKIRDADEARFIGGILVASLITGLTSTSVLLTRKPISIRLAACLSLLGLALGAYLVPRMLSPNADLPIRIALAAGFGGALLSSIVAFWIARRRQALVE